MFPTNPGFRMPVGSQCGAFVPQASAGSVSPFSTQGANVNGVTQMNAGQTCGQTGQVGTSIQTQQGQGVQTQATGVPQFSQGAQLGTQQPMTMQSQMMPSQMVAGVNPMQAQQGAQGQQPLDMMFQMMGMMMTMMMGMLTLMTSLLASRGGATGATGLNPATSSALGGTPSATPGASPSPSGAPATGSTTPAEGAKAVATNPVSTNGAALPLPAKYIKSPVKGLDFGASRDGGGRSHEGNDYMAPKGTPIFAFMGGKVIDVKVASATSGKMVVIQMPNGDFTKYMHMDSWNVQPGQTIEAGQQIGTVGDTGTSPGNTHLHFEYHRGGRSNAVDPWPILQQLLGG